MLQGKRVAILVTDGFEQVELTEPKKALEDAGAEVIIVSPKADKVQGFHHDKPGDSTMILPPDWTFMSKAERKREAYFYSGPRQTYAALLIKEGFTKFWHDFEILVDKAFNGEVSSSLGSN